MKYLIFDKHGYVKSIDKKMMLLAKASAFKATKSAGALATWDFMFASDS